MSTDREPHHERKEGETTEPHARRHGRDGVAPESQPGEFADDMRVNRFTPPPPPKSSDDEK